MPEGLWPAILIVVVVCVWVIAKVVGYARKSEQQWREADKSRLKTWDDEEW